MRHGFTAFPSGLPGAALMALRIGAALSLAQVPDQAHAGSLAALVVYLGVILLVLGLSTRIVAGLAVAACLTPIWLGSQTALPAISHALAALALALIGPGAFSLDARLFGRRTIHLAE